MEKGLLFTGKTDEDETGYALLQVGYGFPRTFFRKKEGYDGELPASNVKELHKKILNEK